MGQQLFKKKEKKKREQRKKETLQDSLHRKGIIYKCDSVFGMCQVVDDFQWMWTIM